MMNSRPVFVRAKAAVWLLAFAFCCTAMAQDVDPTTKQEIAHLIDRLAASGCRFNRNGKWYDAKRSVDHLNRKYEYLLKRNLVPNTEAFIERAASESSVSGKAYLVRCGKEPEVESAAWFRQALEEFRSKQ